MKIRILQILAICVISPVTGHSQSSRNVSLPPSQSDSSTLSSLSENYRLVLKVTQDDKPILNLTMTGLGPTFIMNTVEPIATFQAKIQKKNDTFLVDFSIGEQIKLSVGNNNYEYKNSSIQGAVKLHDGKPVLIAVENGRKYSLSIEAVKNAAEQGAAANP
jgi:hypothetical protein